MGLEFMSDDDLQEEVGVPEDSLNATIRAHVKCCACECRLTESHFLNFVQLNRQAEWAYPSSGNVLTGEMDLAVAAVCDRCLEQNAEIRFAIEWSGIEEGQEFKVIYHPIASLRPVER